MRRAGCCLKSVSQGDLLALWNPSRGRWILVHAVASSDLSPHSSSWTMKVIPLRVATIIKDADIPDRKQLANHDCDAPGLGPSREQPVEYRIESDGNNPARSPITRGLANNPLRHC